METLSDVQTTFDEVVSRLRDVVGLPALDKAVAEWVGMSPAAYGNRKRAGSIPYAEIVSTCVRRRVDLNRVFSGESEGEGRVHEVRGPSPYAEAPPPVPESLRLVRLFGRYSPGLERQAIVGGVNNLPCIEVPERWLEPGERYYANEVWTDSMAAVGIAKGDVVICRATREPPHGAICLINVFKSGFWVREWWPQPDGTAIARGRALVTSEQQETAFTAEERVDVFPLGEAVLVIKRVGQ